MGATHSIKNVKSENPQRAWQIQSDLGAGEIQLEVVAMTGGSSCPLRLAPCILPLVRLPRRLSPRVAGIPRFRHLTAVWGHP